ncbi:nucleolar protein 8 isoform X2 [Neocloeon triangulifer]|uniref:nucleolar protein 8 isoform X2 n=1 Tax=Neocloeon triangulifer TaxID=2078957 RepID=UPI00286EEE50|nr:nucleolar protein 8 isoform X2 [Neocloeon triangulifer]
MNESRLFLGNLPPGISDDDLRQRLKKYGKLSDVNIKQKVDHVGKVTATFAHCTLSTKSDVLKCLDKLMGEGPWNGHSLKAEIAKKSFEQRRQENFSVVSDKTKQIEVPNKPPKAERPPKVKKQPVLNEEESDEEVVFWGQAKGKPENAVEFESEDVKKRKRRYEEPPTKFYKAEATSSQSELLNRLEKFSNVWGDSESSFGPSYQRRPRPEFNGDTSPKISNDLAQLEERKPEKRPKIKSSVKSEEAKPKVASKIDKKLRSEEQRQQSLNQKADLLKKQQNAVKKALSAKNKANTKIKFDDEEEIENGTIKPTSMQLFDDESDGEEIHEDNFKIKKQFEGKRGEKLLELQSSFGLDERFKLDKRFAENEEESDQEAKDNEVENQMAILEGIVGPLSKKPKKEQKMNPIVRFDPSRADHGSKYKITKEQEEVEEEDAEEPLPEVSSERFFEVKTDLKNVLQPNEGFSLRSLFGESEEVEEEAVVQVQEPQEKKKIIKNPLEKTEKPKPFAAEDVTSFSTNGWSVPVETFFYQTNDSRFDDGLEFLKKAKIPTKSEFESKRKDLWLSIKGKNKIVDRRKSTFEKKLGGKPKNKPVKGFGGKKHQIKRK